MEDVESDLRNMGVKDGEQELWTEQNVRGAEAKRKVL